MSTAAHSPAPRSVADVRRLEVAQLISAVDALHHEGVIGTDEYAAKRSALMAGDRCLQPGGIG
jgi:hypothetical protein